MQDLIKVLIVDTDEVLTKDLLTHATEFGVIAEIIGNLQEALQRHSSEPLDIILLRDCLDDSEAGNSILQLLASSSPPELIVFSNHGDAEHAEIALKAGIWDYVVDSELSTNLPKILRRAIRYRQQKKQEKTGNRSRKLSSLLTKYGIIGKSSTLQNCIDITARIAQSESNVLIYGESGTGKELFASAIHALSSRSKKDMTIVDCAALPSTLVESILFGHTKGAFTGANTSQQGLIEQAHNSTLFLDEIGEMPLTVQKKLLRVIQERTFLPVGATTEKRSDFRLITATNRDLEQMVEEGNFREDLLFRLKTFYLELPPLRSRVSDITELVYHCRDLYCQRNKLRRKRFSPDYLMVLRQYDWPGNVRELFQAIERSLADAQEETMLHPKHLPPEIRIEVAKKKMHPASENDQGNESSAFDSVNATSVEMPLKEAREKAIEAQEKAYLAQLLQRTDGDIKKCCDIAGLSRSRLYELLKKYELISSR